MNLRIVLMSVLFLSFLSCELIESKIKGDKKEDEMVVDSTLMSEIEVQVEPTVVQEVDRSTQTKELPKKTSVVKELSTPKLGRGGKVSSSDPEDILELSVLDQVPTLMICSEYSRDRKRTKCSIDTLSDIVLSEFEIEDSLVDGMGRVSVNVRFIVNLDGTISDVELISDFGFGSGKQVVDIVKGFNDKNLLWYPGVIADEPVLSYFELPVRFKFY